MTDIFSGAPAPAYDGGDMVAVMRRFRTGIPWQAVLHSWPLLDSHDGPRFSTGVTSFARRHVGIGLLLTTPGVPMIWSGDEIGLGGAWGEDARRPMPWHDRASWDDATFDVYRDLVRLRRSSDALARGGIRYLHVSADAVLYLRETRGERLLCLAARAAHTPITTPFTQLETLYGGDARDGVLPADGPAFHVWRIT